MGEFRFFLESSTIHGLSYISLTTKYARLFWTIIVIAGFFGAVLIIQDLFQFWSQNPISTTIETLPISEVTFPKVTICPPKGTYTNLNYDLMRVGNQSIDFDLLNENTTAYKLLNVFVRHFQNEDFKRKFALIESFYEDKKFRNWYYGITHADTKNYGQTFSKDVERSTIQTTASSGNISSPYFGEEFGLKNFGLGKTFSILIGNPNFDTIYKKSQVGTIIMKFHYDVLHDFECLSINKYGYSGKCFNPNENNKEVKLENFTGTTIIFTRKSELNVIKLKELRPRKITGFRVSWKYIDIPSNSTEDFMYKNFRPNQNFKKVTNMLMSMNQEIDKISRFWNTVKQTKVNWMDRFMEPESFGYCIKRWCQKLPEELHQDFIEEIEMKIDRQKDQNIMSTHINISDNDLKTAASIYIYIMTEQEEYLTHGYQKYSEKLQQNSLQRIIGKYNDENTLIYL